MGGTPHSDSGRFDPERAAVEENRHALSWAKPCDPNAQLINTAAPDLLTIQIIEPVANLGSKSRASKNTDWRKSNVTTTHGAPLTSRRQWRLQPGRG